MILNGVQHRLRHLSAPAPLSKKTKWSVAPSAGNDWRTQEIGKSGMVSSVLLQLLVDGFCIISEGCLKLGILAEVAVLLHVYIVTYLFQGRALV